MNTSGAILAEYSPPGGTPWDITSGPEGKLWFVVNNSKVGENAKIGKISTAGVITEYSVPFEGVGQLVSGPDGNIWFVPNLRSNHRRRSTR